MNLRKQLCKLLCPNNIEAIKYTYHEGFPENPKLFDRHYEMRLKKMFAFNSKSKVWIHSSGSEFLLIK